MNDCGGGRGYIATQDLIPGTLLLVEEPIFTWPENQLGKELGLQSITAIINDERPEKKLQQLIWAMEELHPTKIDVDKAYAKKDSISSTAETKKGTLNDDQIYGMMNMLEQSFDANESNKSILYQLLQISKTKNLCASDKSPLQARDLIRMLLSLRYNGFGSGLYLHFSIFNHDCDPNCIKFFPTTSD